VPIEEEEEEEHLYIIPIGLYFVLKCFSFTFATHLFSCETRL
jgi:hypothetical protein